jgi:transposase-like protein
VFKKKVLMRLLGTEEEVTRGWRKLHNKEHCNSCTSPDIVRIIKSWRRIRKTKTLLPLYRFKESG